MEFFIKLITLIILILIILSSISFIWIILRSIFYHFSWADCYKCKRPIKKIRYRKLCKICKREGFRFKTKKQMLYEAWEKNIDLNNIDEIYKK